MRKTFSTSFIEEPILVFGHGEEEKDPKKGLFRSGPFTYHDENPSLHNIRVGIISNRNGISLTLDILEKIKEKIPSYHESNTWLYPSYPGMNKESNFLCNIITPNIMQSQISDDLEFSRIKNKNFKNSNERIAFGVNLFAKKIKEIAMDEDKPDVIICTLPEIVETYCGISEKTRGAKTRKLTQHEKKTQKFKEVGQTFLSEWGVEIINITEQNQSYDFRNALKGKIIEFGIPIQILHETTCKNILDFDSTQKHKSQDPCSFAWNFSTALLYKSNGRPWRLAKLPADTCYIGISFFKDKLNPADNMEISMAQIFLHTGESLVLRGNEVYMDEHTRNPHLKRSQAIDLLSKAIQIYKSRTKQTPGRLVIHKTTEFLKEERDGFNQAILENSIYRKDFVSIKTEHYGINFMRAGMFPPLRGTIINLDEDSFLLYSSGYTSQIRTYPGHSIPTPLKIKHDGESSNEEVAKEILNLTKLNWNTTSFSTSLPITIKLAREVGKILSEMPDKEIRNTSYKFFM